MLARLERNHQCPGKLIVMLAHQDQHGLGAAPDRHQPEQNRKIFSNTPAALPRRNTNADHVLLHDFFHTMMIAVAAGRA